VLRSARRSRSHEAPNRGEQPFGAVDGEDRVERGWELPIAIPDQEAQRVEPFAEIHGQVAGGCREGAAEDTNHNRVWCPNLGALG
jgi:hypothetical protein